jgi:formylglycine-generating enzyme
MKYFIFLVIIQLAVTLPFITCGGGGGSGDDVSGGHSAGDMETYIAGGVLFNMAYVPGGKTFPTGLDDNGDLDGDGFQDVDPTATVTNAYWIAETELTYELWKKVYDWATDASRGANQYHFANVGKQGDNGSRGVQHPVTTVNWRDSMVWCNALTEWYNAQKGTNYECVYTYSNAIIRDSRDSNATACDSADANSTASGFRLLTSDEWGLAARWRDGILWTPGNHVSGDTSSYCYPPDAGTSTVFGDYAVYWGNSGSSTAVVKSKVANSLGLYDMSGNVLEWCFDWHPRFSGSRRVCLAGGWNGNGYTLQMGFVNSDVPYDEGGNIGFRFARSE